MSKRAYQKEYNEYLENNPEVLIPYNTFARRLTDKKRYWNRKRKARREMKAKLKNERTRRIKERLALHEKKAYIAPKKNWYDCIVTFFKDLF